MVCIANKCPYFTVTTNSPQSVFGYVSKESVLGFAEAMIFVIGISLWWSAAAFAAPPMCALDCQAFVEYVLNPKKLGDAN